MTADRLLLSDGSLVLLSDGSYVLLSTTTTDETTGTSLLARAASKAVAFTAPTEAVAARAQSKAIAYTAPSTASGA